MEEKLTLKHLRQEHQILQQAYVGLQEELARAARRLQEARRDLDMSERRYRSLYTTMSEGVVLYEVVQGPEGKVEDYVILDVNPAYEVITGARKEEIVGGRVSGLGEGLVPLQEEMLASCAETGQAICFEMDEPNLGKSLQVSVYRTSERQLATVIRDVTQEKASKAKIDRMAHYDQLTDLPNRTLFRTTLDRCLAQARVNKTRMALLFVDLDCFKAVNDACGHAVGDRVLEVVARRLQGLVRFSDSVARLGGDEFVVILEHAMRREDCTLVARRIIDRLNEPIEVDGRHCDIGASIGVAVYPMDAQDADGLVSCADKAMYRAKEQGRNTCIFFSDIQPKPETRQLPLV